MRIVLLLTVIVLLFGCSGGDSGTIKPSVQQMKPGARGTHRP